MSRIESTTLAVTMIVTSVLILSLGDALVKHISGDFSLWQIYVTRGLIAVPILTGLLLLLQKKKNLILKSWRWVCLRSILLVVMWIAFYTALPLMNMSVAAVALYTTPLFIALFSAFLIGESVGIKQWIAITIGFLGVLVILRPDSSAFSFVTLLPILAAILYALAAIITRSKCNEEHPLILALGLNICLLITGLIGTTFIAFRKVNASELISYKFLQGPWSDMGLPEWGYIFILAVVLIVVSTGVAKAYQIGPASIVGVFDNAYLVFAVLWGVIFFDEVLDISVVLGVMLVATAGWIVVSKST